MTELSKPFDVYRRRYIRTSTRTFIGILAIALISGFLFAGLGEALWIGGIVVIAYPIFAAALLNLARRKMQSSNLR